MNIRGPYYSKATAAMRQVGTSPANRHLQLVFIYPILLDESLSDYGDIIRTFIAKSMIREIFVSNIIKMVNLASQIHPITDERGKAFKVIPAREMGGDDRYSLSNTVGSVYGSEADTRAQTQLRMELQQKLQRKTNTIKQLLNTDPMLVKYKPEIEIIDMDNLMEVPVIVGTQQFPVESEPILMLLTVAAASHYTLNNSSNIEILFKVISSTPPQRFNLMLNTIVKKRDTDAQQFYQWLKSSSGIRWAGNRVTSKATEYINKIKSNRFYNTASDYTPDLVKRIGGTVYTKALEKVQSTIAPNTLPTRSVTDAAEKFQNIYKVESFDSDDTFTILKTVKDNIGKVKGMFNVCTDEKQAQNKFGYRLGVQDSGNTDIEQTVLKGPISDVINNIKLRWNKILTTYGQPVLVGYVNLLMPEADRSIANTSPVALIGDIFHKTMTDKLDDLVDKNLAGALKNTLSRDSDIKVDTIKKLCMGEFKDVDKITSEITNKIRYLSSRGNAVTAGIRMSAPEITEFDEALDFAVTKSSGYLRALINILSNLIESVEVKEISNSFNDIVNAALAEVLNKFNTFYTTTNNFEIYKPAAMKVLNLSEPDYNTFRKNLMTSVSSYLKFLFFYNIQIGLCDYIDVISSDIEVAKHDVTTFPNYVLVIPIEMMYAIAHGIVAKSWKRMLNNDYSPDIATPLLRDNNIKKVIQLLATKMEIPNLIVIDKRKSHIYYKLMHYTEVQRTNIESLKAFNNLSLSNNY